MFRYSIAPLILNVLLLVACSDSSSTRLIDVSDPENLAGYHAIRLAEGAAEAWQNQRIEDAALLFYASQLRVKYDRGMYPPIETGGNDPLLAIGALLFGLGGAINPAVMAEPEVFARVCERLSDYRPEAASGDDPGYRFAREEGFDIEVVASAFDKERTTYLATMADLSYLLSQPDYGAAFRTLQRSSPGGAGDPPSESEVEKALETMRRIQEETGRQGVI